MFGIERLGTHILVGHALQYCSTQSGHSSDVHSLPEDGPPFVRRCEHSTLTRNMKCIFITNE